MIETSVIDLPGFVTGRLRSERIRILCMAAVFAAFVLLGNFRIVFPYASDSAIGWIVLGVSAAYLVFELLMFRVIGHNLRQETAINPALGWLHALTECLYPIAVLFLLVIQHPNDRYTLLVSPGYPFLHILIAVSVLRVDWRATALTGLISIFGYAGLVGFVLSYDGLNTPGPHPSGLYVVLTGMLAISTTASVFVAIEFRGYLVAAARELVTRRQRDRLQRDLEIARAIQQQLLPSLIPELTGYQIAAISLPADETGGDYYDWQPISTQRVVFSLGDVTGHGIGPALVTSACRAYVRATLGGAPPSKDVMEKVNHLLSRDLPEGRFVTLVLIDLNAETHESLLLSAGHGPTLHLSGNNGSIRRIGSQGLPLGLLEGLTWDQPVKLCLGIGDVLVILSDGFFEPANPAGEAFGLDRLEQVIQQCSHDSAERIVAVMESSVRQFLNGASQPDDMTAVVIKRNR